MRFSIMMAAGFALLVSSIGCTEFICHEAGRCDCDARPTISCYYGGDMACCHAPIIGTPVIKPVEIAPIPVPNK